MEMKIIFWFWCTLTCLALVGGAVIPDDDVDQQGLYSKSDGVDILTNRNFERKVYGKDQALLIQFYNSYCGHCRAFAPKFKDLASTIAHWTNIIRLAVIDCSIEENNEICRQFEVLAYPSLRYLHENYAKGNGNVGEKVQGVESAEYLKSQLIIKMRSEKAMGRLPKAPSFDIASYSSYANAIKDLPSNIMYTFLIFEEENSTIGSELLLDLNEYKDIKIRRVYATTELAEVAGVSKFPGLVVVKSNLETTNITPLNPTKPNLLKAIKSFLKTNNYEFPQNNRDTLNVISNEQSGMDYSVLPNTDVIYFKDIEKTLKMSLHTEITRYKTLSEEPLQALMDYLDVLLIAYPFRGNLKPYLENLRATLATRNSWSGSEIYDLVKSLEVTHAPVFPPNLDYVACKGSLPRYRGYTCGLWTLFHTLTVNAARKPGKQGPKVLKAMHGYVKHFFGCTECAQHFQAMAERNRLFDVKENDKAVLWLWISHNEVNLRLAGDFTEDPQYPKIQFPSITRCPECRLPQGTWNLAAVYQYLQGIYGAENIRDTRSARSAAVAPTPFSNLDIGMLSLLYILSFIILILVIKHFLTKRLHRKRLYKHGRGKV